MDRISEMEYGSIRAHTAFERRKIYETLHLYFGFLTFC